MDDFDETYLERQRQFEQGLKKGIEQADAYDLHDIRKEGEQFGHEFVKELAMYESFERTFYRLKINEQFKNQRVQQIFGQIRKIVQEIDFKSLETLKGQRGTLEKKFQLLMAMMGIKKTTQKEVFQIKKTKEGLDF